MEKLLFYCRCVLFLVRDRIYQIGFISCQKKNNFYSVSFAMHKKVEEVDEITWRLFRGYL